MLRNIQKCTIIAEAHSVFGNNDWAVAIDELGKYLGFTAVRDAIGNRTLSMKDL